MLGEGARLFPLPQHRAGYRLAPQAEATDNTVRPSSARVIEADMVIPMNDRARTQRPRQFIDHRAPGWVTLGASCVTRMSGFLRSERLNIFRPNRGGGQRMRQSLPLLRTVAWPERGEIAGQFVTVP